MKLLGIQAIGGAGARRRVIGAPLAALAQNATKRRRQRDRRRGAGGQRHRRQRARHQRGRAAAAAAPAGNPDATHDYTKDSVNSGDDAWMLTSSVLVLMMTIPGLALFYAGMVRKKNILATLAQSFGATAVITVLWMVIGYSIAFTGGGRRDAAVHRRASSTSCWRR